MKGCAGLSFERKQNSLFLILLFIALAAVRYLLSAYPQAASFSEDEIVYLEAAQSLWHGGSLSAFLAPARVEHPLYALLLAPFYALEDGAARLSAIALLNAVLAASCVFPAWLLARRFLHAPAYRWTAVGLLVISPALLLSMTDMAENMVFPLRLWILVLLARLFLPERKSPVRLYIAGAVTVLCLLLRFLLLQTLFPALPAVRFSSGPDVIALLYAAGYCLVWFLGSILIFPALLPALRFSALPEKIRKLFAFAWGWTLLITLRTVFFRILPESSMVFTPHVPMFKYFGCGFCFLLCTLASIEDDAIPVRWKKPVYGLTACLTVLLLAGNVLQFSAIRSRNTVSDPEILHQAAALDRRLNSLEPDPETGAPGKGGTVMIFADDPSGSDFRALAARLGTDCAVLSAKNLRVLATDAPEPGRIEFSGSSQSHIPTLLSADGGDSYQLSAVHYYVCLGTTADALIGNRYVDITPEDFTAGRVLEALNPSFIAASDPLSLETGSFITFHDPNPNCGNYLLSGFYGSEPGFTWAGANASITFAPETRDVEELSFTWTWAMTFGAQRARITAGDQVIFDGDMPAENALSFTVPISAMDSRGRLTLCFDFPDARKPGGGDERMLSVAFAAIHLTGN